MAKTAKKKKPGPWARKKAKQKAEPKPVNYGSPEVIREWDDAYHKLARELAEKHAATKSAYLEMKDQLPKMKKRVEGLDEEIREAEERWRRYRGHKPPSTQGTLDNLRTQSAEYTEPKALAAGQDTAAKVPAPPAGWFPEDLWKKVPIERWEKYGLSADVIEKMKAGSGKGKRTVPPIHTVGDIAGFAQPYPNDPTFTNSFAHIKGIGAETATKIEEAQEKFWKDWNDGYATAFAMEQGHTPPEGASNADDKSTPDGAGAKDTSAGNAGERTARKPGRSRKNADPNGPLSGIEVPAAGEENEGGEVPE